MKHLNKLRCDDLSQNHRFLQTMHETSQYIKICCFIHIKSLLYILGVGEIVIQ